VTDTSADRQFNAMLTPSPFRIPNAILWGAAVLIGFGMLAFGYFSRGAINSGSLPMLILISASAAVSGSAILAHGDRRGRLSLYFGAAMLVAVAAWLAFDDFQTRGNTRAAERGLSAGLIQLCQSAGGQDLSDPACAEQRRVLDGYYDAKWGDAPATTAP
jgi:hypothetical protein